MTKAIANVTSYPKGFENWWLEQGEERISNLVAYVLHLHPDSKFISVALYRDIRDIAIEAYKSAKGNVNE